MLNVAKVLSSPRLCQPFTIYRTTGAFGRGGWIADAAGPAMIAAYGVISVINEKELATLPEGDRIKGAMVFHSTTEMKVTRPEGTSDQLLWRGELYRVVNIAPYADYGYYRAVAVRMKGN